MKLLRQSAVGLLLAAVGSMLSGCSAAMKPVRMTGLAAKDLTLQFTVDEEANLNSAIPVDVVAVRDKSTYAQVAALSASQWFAKKNDVLRMKGRNVLITSYEFVPGTVVPEQHITSGIGKFGVIFFANYSTKGEHRAALPLTGRVPVHLAAEDFVLALPKEAKEEEKKKKKAPKPPKLPKAPKPE